MQTPYMNIFELKCLGHQVGKHLGISMPSTNSSLILYQDWDTNWDKCYVEPTCSDLPNPEVDAPNTGLRKKDEKATKIKVGEVMVFECINRTHHHETPTVMCHEAP